VPFYQSNTFSKRTITFGRGKTTPPTTSFIIAANIVKFKVMQERAFTSSTVACKAKVSAVLSDLYALTDLAILQQRQTKVLFRHTDPDTANIQTRK